MAHIDVPKELGQTALIAAAYKGHKEIVDLLLANGAKAEILNRDGQSALTIAQHIGELEILGLLRARTTERSSEDIDDSGQAVAARRGALGANPAEG